MDGTNLEIKVSFATIYYMGKNKTLGKLSKKKNPTQDENLELAANMIYIILRSNGRTVTFDEALALTPPDPDEISRMAEEFTKRLDDYKKKVDAKKMSIPNK